MATKKAQTAKEAVKEETKKAADVVKETATKAKEATKKTAQKATKEVKEVAKKAEMKVEEKKEEVKKEVTKKAPAKKTSSKKTQEVYFEFAGKQVNPTDVTELVKKAYVADGHKASSIKSIKLYIKAEDSAVYFVINDTETGKIAL